MFDTPAVNQSSCSRAHAHTGMGKQMEEDRNLSIEVDRKPTHTDQYLRFDSHHPLEHKMSVIKTLQHRAKEIPTTTEGTKKEQEHIKITLKTCRYTDWAFSKTSRKRDPNKEHTHCSTRPDDSPTDKGDSFNSN